MRKYGRTLLEYSSDKLLGGHHGENRRSRNYLYRSQQRSRDVCRQNDRYRRKPRSRNWPRRSRNHEENGPQAAFRRGQARHKRFSKNYGGGRSRSRKRGTKLGG